MKEFIILRQGFDSGLGIDYRFCLYSEDTGLFYLWFYDINRADKIAKDINMYQGISERPAGLAAVKMI